MNSKLLSIGATAKLLGVSIDTLRSWAANNILTAFRPDPNGNRYYLKQDIEKFIAREDKVDHVSLARKWSRNKVPISLPTEFYCETVDVFSARLQSLNLKLEQEADLKTISPLLTAIVGEIGNNSFNHNLGNWPDLPGVFFAYELQERQIVLADRGQGVLKTLQRVLPKLKTDAEALKIAFTEYISGRAPENRGNGLKFVKDVIWTHPIQLQFFSGSAELKLKKNDTRLEVERSENTFHGSMAIIHY